MDSKLNLFDIFGILMPGSVFLLETYFFIRCFGINLPFDLGTLTATLLVLPLAYVCGCILHQGSRLMFYETKYAASLLEKRSAVFEEAFKAQLIAAILERFGAATFGDDLCTREQQQSAFNLCYYEVIQKGKGVYVENYSGVNSLHRQMILVVFIGFIYFMMLSVSVTALDKTPLWFKISCGLVLGFLIIRLWNRVRKPKRLKKLLEKKQSLEKELEKETQMEHVRVKTRKIEKNK